MTAYADWEQANSRFLADQLASLRTRLERLAHAQGAAAALTSGTPADIASPPPASWLERLFKRAAPTAR